MSRQNPHVAGAEAPPRMEDPELQDVVASLVHLSMTERDGLASYSLRDCDEMLRDLGNYANNPAGKPQRSLPDLLGQMFLIQQRKAQLQHEEYMEQLAELHRSHQTSQTKLQQEAQSAQAELARAQEEREALRTVIQKIQEDSDSSSDESQVSIAVSPSPQGINRADKDLPPPPTGTGSSSLAADRQPPLAPPPPVKEAKALDEASQLRMELQAAQARELALHRRLEAAQLQQLSTPVDMGARPRSLATPGDGAFHLPALDAYQASSTAHSRSLTAPSSREVLQSALAPKGQYYDQTPSTQRSVRYRPHPYDEFGYEEMREDPVSPLPPSYGLRTRQIESLSRDVERFDPRSHDSNIDDYLREIERCLIDLPSASAREKLKLVWKTTAREVHVFMETLPAETRDWYPALCKALREEYSPYMDEASATFSALNITQRKQEPPREYYRRLRAAYFQGRNAPGLEEEQAFRSLFLHNLHDDIRYDVTMHCRTGKHTMQEIRRYAQLAWETRVRPKRGHNVEARVLEVRTSENDTLMLEGDEVPRPRANFRAGPQGRRPPRQQGDAQSQRHGGQAPFNPQKQDSYQAKGRVHFEQNAKRPNQTSKALNVSKKQRLKREMEDLMRKCLGEISRQFEAPRSLPGPTDPPKGPGPGPSSK